MDHIPWFLTASHKKRWLVGVSGGADSVALLQLLVTTGFKNLIVCHLDHRLRGRTSTEDAKFVKRLAESLGVTCEIGTADIKQRMKTTHASLETVARNARHEFFAECAQKYHCRRVLLAHHADDQAETVLWNLVRGSKGFKGMRVEQKLCVKPGITLELSRPLLGLRHGDLLEWLVAQGMTWREDASNLEPIAVRNRLRNEIFPLLAKIAKRDVVPAFARSAEDAEDTEALEMWALDQANVLDPQGRLHVPTLRLLPLVLQRLAVLKFLQTHRVLSVDRDLIHRALSLLDVKSPAVINLPGGGRLRRQAARLWIEPLES